MDGTLHCESINSPIYLNCRVINRWGLTVLESCERPSNRSVISIQFNTMRSDKKQRFYLMADETACLVRSREGRRRSGN